MSGPGRDLPPLAVLGVMSGTSLDGVDAVLARFEVAAGRWRWEVLARERRPYPAALEAALERALRPGGADAAELAQLDAEVGEAYADAVQAVQARAAVELVALSGQTVYHIPAPDPERGWRARATLQLGEPARVVERCGVPVVSGLRQADFAAGGGGAPMVSWGDLQLFAEPGRARAVQNLGGIANLTWLPPDGDPGRVLAFDTGPASCLIDEAMRERYGRPYDEAGGVAAGGAVDGAALASWLEHPYFREPPPKTTGREAFHLGELEPLHDPARLADADLVATLTALTAESVARAYRAWVLPRGLDEVLVAGGGARNDTLMARLRALLEVPVRPFEELGWDSKDREALAFAAMGYARLHGLPNTLPAATGARHPAISGAVSLPHAPQGDPHR